MNKYIKDGLFRIDSNQVEKKLEKSLLFGDSNLLKRLLGFSNLILKPEKKEMLSRLDFNPTILLYGPPNTGKTTTAFKLFKEIKSEINNANLYLLSVSNLMSSEYGSTSKNLVGVFEELQKLSSFECPSILIIDEIDQICMSRNKDNEHDASRRAMSSLMLEMDRLHPSTTNGIIVIGITNVPEKIDSAVIRRFSLKIEVDFKLTFSEFKKYLEELFRLCGKQNPVDSTIEKYFALYENRRITIPDIKGFFRKGIVEDIINEELNLIAFIEMEFKNGYSSIENTLE